MKKTLRFFAEPVLAFLIATALGGAGQRPVADQPSLNEAVSFPSGWFAGEAASGAAVAFDPEAEVFAAKPTWVVLRIAVALPASAVQTQWVSCLARSFDGESEVSFPIQVLAQGRGAVISSRAGETPLGGWRPGKYTLNCSNAEQVFAAQTFGIPAPPGPQRGAEGPGPTSPGQVNASCSVMVGGPPDPNCAPVKPGKAGTANPK